MIRIQRIVNEAGCLALLAAAGKEGAMHHSRDMEPRGLGRGCYHQWRDAPPEPALSLLAGVYRHLSPHLTAWPGHRPADLADFHQMCRTQGQTRHASILLAYGPNGCNHPHRDIYGPVVHPVQGVLVLSRRGPADMGGDFEGGDVALWEGTDPAPVRRCAADLGDLVLFASQTRRPTGQRVVHLRHGMTPLTHGERYAFGMVFHLAR